MKTHKCNLLKKGVLVVEMPENSTFKEIFGLIGADENNTPNYHLSIHNACDYTLLGKPDEISEENVKDLLLDYFTIGLPQRPTPIEYFNSILESEIYWDVNPYGKPDEFIGEHKNPGYEMWDESQSRTFDRNRTIIFIEN